MCTKYPIQITYFGSPDRFEPNILKIPNLKLMYDTCIFLVFIGLDKSSVASGLVCN